MKQGLSEIVLVADRSGSMSAIQADAQGGINTFLKEQAKELGEARLTLVQFDTDYEVVHDNVPLRDLPEYKLIPRGGTALFDAVNRAIGVVGERLSKTAEADRPEHVIVVIVTDGHENSSHEVDRDTLLKTIKTQQDVWKWQFTYICAGIDGFRTELAAVTPHAAILNAGKTPGAVHATYAAMSANVSRARRGMAMSYTSAERKKSAG